jgi:hypothetical protein
MPREPLQSRSANPFGIFAIMRTGVARAVDSDQVEVTRRQVDVHALHMKQDSHVFRRLSSGVRLLEHACS